MGGVLIVGSVLISTLLWARLSSLYIWTIDCCHAPLRRHRFYGRLREDGKTEKSGGVTGRQKLFQFLIARWVWTVLLFRPSGSASDYSWNVSIPFFLKATAEPYGCYIGPTFTCFDRHRLDGLVKRGKSDGWARWSGD